MKIKSKLLQLEEGTVFADSALESLIGTHVHGIPGVVTDAWVENNWVFVKIDMDTENHMVNLDTFRNG